MAINNTHVGFHMVVDVAFKENKGDGRCASLENISEAVQYRDLGRDL